MNALALISRIIAPLVKGTEGAYRPGPYQLPISGGWLPDGSATNFWQLGYDPRGISTPSAMVEACVSSYAQTVAMLPGDHWRTKDNGGRERVTNSALSRILRRPNDYQSISDFLLNATRSLYLEGNTYALALRNSRFEIAELHLMDARQCHPQLAVTGDIFYHLAGNSVIDARLGKPARLIVPARDVLHIRLHSTERKTPFPLVGETPLTAALADIATTNSITQQQIQFYQNQARPSAVLSTDLILPLEKVEELRQMWNNQAKGLDGCGPGGTPILTAGLKVQPWSTPGKDAQIAEVMKFSAERIALVFRVPLQVLGIGGTPYGSTELLMQSWIASGLGFALNHIEEAFGLTFGLYGQPDEYLELNTGALLRSAFKDRIDGLARAVQGGIFSPNEARRQEDLPEVEYGEEPRVQQQVVPLSFAKEPVAAPPKLPTGDAPPPAPPAGDAPPAAKPQKPQKDYPSHVQRLSRTFSHAADAYDRRVDS